MSGNSYSGSQVIQTPKEVESGRPVSEVLRKHGVSAANKLQI